MKLQNIYPDVFIPELQKLHSSNWLIRDGKYLSWFLVYSFKQCKNDTSPNSLHTYRLTFIIIMFHLLDYKNAFPASHNCSNGGEDSLILQLHHNPTFFPSPLPAPSTLLSLSPYFLPLKYVHWVPAMYEVLLYKDLGTNGRRWWLMMNVLELKHLELKLSSIL